MIEQLPPAELNSTKIVQDEQGRRQLQLDIGTTVDGAKRASVLMEMAFLDVAAINNLVENMSEEDVELQWQHYEDERTGKNQEAAIGEDSEDLILPETPKILDANGLPAGSVLAKDLEQIGEQ